MAESSTYSRPSTRWPGGPAVPPEEVDVVVVGVGAAGSVVAARLTEDPACTVAAFEVGGPNDDEAVRIPGHGFALWQSDLVWPTPTVTQAAAGGRVVPLLTGRGLGGGSALNAMGWIQGQPADFAEWEAAGAAGWSWPELQAVFRGLEDHELGASEYHGAAGPMAVGGPAHVSPLAMAFIQAGAELGYPVSTDLNGSQRTGFSLAPGNVRGGRRHSVVDGYLEEASTRPNLHLHLQTRVDRVLLEGRRAVGVQISHPGTGRIRTVLARRAVVLTAGAIRSPQLLMLSGIGPAEHLRSMGVVPVQDVPAVGKHLQDHPAVFVAAQLQDVERARGLAYERATEYYHLQRRGPLSALGQGFAVLGPRGSGDPDAPPDLHIGFTPLGADAGLPDLPIPMAGTQVALVDPLSRGEVRLKSADPAADLIVDPHYLQHPADRPRMRDGLRVLQALLRADALHEFVTEPFPPLPDDDAGLDLVIDANLTSYHHPVGTARIGAPSDGVVDPHLKVHGIDALWVVDASVMPRITRGNTHATTLAIAERGTTFVRAALQDGPF